MKLLSALLLPLSAGFGLSAGPQPTGPAVPPAATGVSVYQRACQSCHQADGKGQPGLYPPLRGSDWVKATDPARLIRITLHGMVGPLSINGIPFRSNAPFMPGHAASLTDQEIASVLTWIRAGMGGNAPEVSAAMVTSIRQAETGRAALWTQAELLAIPLAPPKSPPPSPPVPP